MTASEEQKTRTKAEEGVSLEAYADTQDPPVWTVGFGHAATNPIPVRGELDGEPYVGPPARGVSISIQEADRLFDEDAHEHEDAINSGVDSRVELTQGQFDALFDFCHHYGPSRFLGSTLLEKINFNPTATENIAAQFQRWNINAGRRDPAIYRRACRRACVYAGVPIPNLLWKTPQNGFPWKVSPDDEIDHSVTPTAFQFIQMGKKVATPYKFDPSEPISKPAPEVAAEPSGGVGGGQLGQPSAPPPIASAPSPDSAKPKPELVLKTPIPPVVKGSEGPPPVVKRPTVPPPVAAPVPSRVVISARTMAPRNWAIGLAVNQPQIFCMLVSRQ
jgi:GH24 family phage-related lysozyme (muramidase)